MIISVISIRHRFWYAAMAVILAIAAFSCGDSESFTIEGSIEGNPTMNLRFIYSSNGTLIRGLTAARNGKFEYKGVTSTPTILQILDNDYRPLGWLYVANGNHITCKLVRNNPYAISVSGSEVSERWAAFLNKNASDLSTSSSNDVIESYVATHPNDIMSTLIVLTSYDASRDALRADSIMSSIDPSVRPSYLVDGFNSMLQRLVSRSVDAKVAPIPFFNLKDSLTDFQPSARPWSVIAVSDANSGRADSIVPTFRKLYAKKNRKVLQIIDFSVDRDTIAWHKSVSADSAQWNQGWAPGSIASPGIDRLAIPTVPFFIVVDSTGRSALRTPSVSVLEAFVDSCINSKRP